MIYFDNGATSFPKPRGMMDAMMECMANYCGNPGRSGHDMSIKTGEEIYRTRSAIGKLFGIKDASRILFTSGTTEALNMGIKGNLEEGDHVITTAMEHNSVLRPLWSLGKKNITMTIIPCDSNGMPDLATMEQSIQKNTKMMICTHASNVTGTIMPLAEIAKITRANQILLFVDAAQSAGSIPIDVNEMNFDLMAAPGHKGLLGPMGTGILYVRDGISMKPLKEGGTGTRSRDLNQPEEFPDGFESGTLNAPGIVGLGYSADYLGKIGIEEIARYEQELVIALDEALNSMKRVVLYGPQSRMKTGIATFNIIGKDCEEISERLNSEFGIASRAGYHCAPLAHKTIGTYDTGAVRFSIGPYNTKREIKLAVDAVYQLQKA